MLNGFYWQLGMSYSERLEQFVVKKKRWQKEERECNIDTRKRILHDYTPVWMWELNIIFLAASRQAFQEVVVKIQGKQVEVLHISSVQVKPQTDNLLACISPSWEYKGFLCFSAWSFHFMAQQKLLTNTPVLFISRWMILHWAIGNLSLVYL